MRRSLKLPSMLAGAALIASAMLSFPAGPAAAAQIYVTAFRMPVDITLGSEKRLRARPELPE